MTTDYQNWICPDCGHEVVAAGRPEPMRWSDGHVCRFVLDMRVEDVEQDI